jgi:hypothetical protein
MDSSLLLAVGASLLTHAPTFLVWFGAIAVALLRPNLPRRAMAFLVGGLVTQLVQSIVGTAVSVSMPFKLMQGGMTASEVGRYLAVWSIAWSFLSAAGWVLVLVAVFVDRETPAKRA